MNKTEASGNLLAVFGRGRCRSTNILPLKSLFLVPHLLASDSHIVSEYLFHRRITIKKKTETREGNFKRISSLLLSLWAGNLGGGFCSESNYFYFFF